MSTTARQAAEAVKAVAHQYRSIMVVGEYLDSIAGLEQVKKEAEDAAAKAQADRDKVVEGVQREKAAAEAAVRTAKATLAEAQDDLKDTVEANKTALAQGKRTLAEQAATIAERKQEIAALDEKLAASKKKVAAFLAD